MRGIGFSTGALALADFRLGLNILRQTKIRHVELSALRVLELDPLIQALDELDLSQFVYIAVHAPSHITPENEADIAQALAAVASRNWPIVVHADVIHNISLWRRFSALLLIENMDRRKASGRSLKELSPLFDQLPEARLCFDLGHARQIDTSMTEAYLILKALGSRLGQVHLSEVNSSSKHDLLSYGSMLSFKYVSRFIPEEIPVILESPVTKAQIPREVERALEVFAEGNTAKAQAYTASQL